MRIKLGPANFRDGEMRGFAIGRRNVVVAKIDGAYKALDDWCNHAGCLLSGGWLDTRKSAVVCPCHEYSFELGSGRNVTFPRLCGDQPAFQVRVENGRVMMELPE